MNRPIVFLAFALILSVVVVLSVSEPTPDPLGEGETEHANDSPPSRSSPDEGLADPPPVEAESSSTSEPLPSIPQPPAPAPLPPEAVEALAGCKLIVEIEPEVFIGLNTPTPVPEDSELAREFLLELWEHHRVLDDFISSAMAEQRFVAIYPTSKEAVEHVRRGKLLRQVKLSEESWGVIDMAEWQNDPEQQEFSRWRRVAMRELGLTMASLRTYRTPGD